MEQEFLEFAASVLDVDVKELSMLTEYGSIPQWDSLMHLCLVDEIYEKYGIDIPVHVASNIRTLGEFYDYVKGGGWEERG